MSTLSTPTLPLDRAADQTTRRAAPTPALALGLGLTLLAFWPTLASFPVAWLDRGGQGFVVAIFCGYLAWKDRERLMSARTPMPVVSALLFGMSLFWLLAFVLNVQVVHQAVLPMIVLFWLLAVLGKQSFVAALPIVGTFFLAVPIWGVLIRPLQSMTVMANSVLLKLSGIQADIRGEQIEIPSGVFWVASGCAGLNYFETGLLVSVIYSLAFLNTWKARGVAVAIALALAIVSNWLRVFGLIVVGHVTEMQSPLIAEHALYGWLIFGAAMIVFFMLTRRVEAYDARLSAAAVKTDPAAGTHSRSLSESESPQPPRRQAKAAKGGVFKVSTPIVTLAVATAIVGPALFFLLGGRAATGQASERASGVTPDGQWSLSEAGSVSSPSTSVGAVETDSAKAWAPEYGGADEHRVERWTNGDVAVQVDRFLYADQGQGRELISGVNHISSAGGMGQQLLGPVDETGRMISATAVRTNGGARLVWHWFNVAGLNTHSSTEAKMLELVAFAKSNAPPSELVAVSTPCGASDCQEAMQTLFRFVLGREIAAESSQPPSAPRR